MSDKEISTAALPRYVRATRPSLFLDDRSKLPVTPHALSPASSHWLLLNETRPRDIPASFARLCHHASHIDPVLCPVTRVESTPASPEKETQESHSHKGRARV